jgi:hypothetical protein
LPPTIALFAPRCSQDVVCALAQAPGHGPGARHATRKLMAPPLRFFVLPAFLSLGSRSAPDCLTGTIRSQGFSPSQRFNPARALRLCFTSLPPLGFSAFRAFPTQPAATPLGARCSFVVSSSSGLDGLPHRPLCPSLSSTADWCLNAVPCHEASVQLNERSNIISLERPKPDESESGHSACRGLEYSDSSRSSAVLHRSSGTTSSWRGMPTLELCSD